MAAAIFTITAPTQPPTLSDAAQKLGVAETDLDHSFGVVLLDPQKHLYAVRCLKDPVPKMLDEGDCEGPFSDPEIGTYHI